MPDSISNSKNVNLVDSKSEQQRLFTQMRHRLIGRVGSAHDASDVEKNKPVNKALDVFHCEIKDKNGKSFNALWYFENLVRSCAIELNFAEFEAQEKIILKYIKYLDVYNRLAPKNLPIQEKLNPVPDLLAVTFACAALNSSDISDFIAFHIMAIIKDKYQYFDLETAKKKKEDHIGSYHLNEKGLDTKGTSIVIQDSGFNDTDHGQKVTNVLKGYAPDTSVAQLKWERTEITDYMDDRSDSSNHNDVLIINRSFAPKDIVNLHSKEFKKSIDLFISNVIEATDRGAIVVMSAGNHNEIWGMSGDPKEILHQTYSKINKDPNVPGAVIIVGASKEGGAGKLESYSAIAGLARDYFVTAPRRSTDQKGTSFTSPAVSAALTYLKKAFPELNGKQLSTLLFATAKLPDKIDEKIYSKLKKASTLDDDDLKKFHLSDIYGHGEINVALAYELGMKMRALGKTINASLLKEMSKTSDQIIRENSISEITLLD